MFYIRAKKNKNVPLPTSRFTSFVMCVHAVNTKGGINEYFRYITRPQTPFLSPWVNRIPLCWSKRTQSPALVQKPRFPTARKGREYTERSSGDGGKYPHRQPSGNIFNMRGSITRLWPNDMARVREVSQCCGWTAEYPLMNGRALPTIEISYGKQPTSNSFDWSGVAQLYVYIYAATSLLNWERNKKKHAHNGSDTFGSGSKVFGIFILVSLKTQTSFQKHAHGTDFYYVIKSYEPGVRSNFVWNGMCLHASSSSFAHPRDRFCLRFSSSHFVVVVVVFSLLVHFVSSFCCCLRFSLGRCSPRVVECQ